MGSATGYICRTCGARFRIRHGGGFFFDLLHCDRCGQDRRIGHQELGDIHLGFIKGLSVPYAVARSEMDRAIQRDFPGPALTTEEYHRAAEATLEPCTCGGRFRCDAPARCPVCRSTSSAWEMDPTAARVLYD